MPDMGMLTCLICRSAYHFYLGSTDVLPVRGQGTSVYMGYASPLFNSTCNIKVLTSLFPASKDPTRFRQLIKRLFHIIMICSGQ